MPPKSRTLRFKLALWFVLVFVLIQAMTIGGVAFLRKDVVEGSLDAQLRRDAEDMIDNILAAEVDWRLDQIEPLLPADSRFEFFTVREESGGTLVCWNTEPSQVPFSDLQRIPAGPLGAVHTPLHSERGLKLTGVAGELRMITIPFRQLGQQYYFQAAVRDERNLATLLGPFGDLVSMGIPVGILAAAIVGWLIVGKALSPIERISEAARDVSPTNLQERFEVGSSDDELSRLEEELNSALERIEAGYRAQDQFLANASHELKTPIAVLLTQAQVTKMGDRDTHKGYAFVDMTESMMKRLGQLVESLLLLARADIQTSPPTDPVAIVDVVLGCLQSCQLHAQQAHVSLAPNLLESDEENSLVVPGDVDLLQTMIENLVRNAIAHSPRGSRVAMDVSETDEVVSIAVRDQGPGIPGEYIERIFERFVQVPKQQDRRDGSGLGLAIASRITHLHQGDIRAENNAEAGCSFIVTLPKSRAPKEEPAAADESSS